MTLSRVAKSNKILFYEYLDLLSNEKKCGLSYYARRMHRPRGCQDGNDVAVHKIENNILTIGYRREQDAEGYEAEAQLIEPLKDAAKIEASVHDNWHGKFTDFRYTVNLEHPALSKNLRIALDDFKKSFGVSGRERG